MKKEVRDIKRLDEIIKILFEEGFEYPLLKTRLGGKVPFRHRLIKGKADTVEDHEVKFRRTLERLGPTFIKFGQMLSVRPDLLPLSYIRELEKLQDKVPPIPFSDVKKCVEHELGKPISSVFRSFDKKPLAAASLSQVHVAVLKNGKKVAVKVQRPHIKEKMEADLDIMHFFAKLLERHMSQLRRFKPSRIVEEFEQWTINELDFRNEARNAVRFGSHFKGNPQVAIPEVDHHLSTSRVLVTEFLKGPALNDVKTLKRKRINFHKIIHIGSEAILTQVYEHGFFHADPHPGNILVMGPNQIGMVDFGIVGHFDDKLKNTSFQIMLGLIQQDADLIYEAFEEMGINSKNKQSFRNRIEDLILPLSYSSMKEVRISEVSEQLLSAALDHEIRVPREFVLVGKTLYTLEGIALEYDPDMNFVQEMQPFMEKLLKRHYSPVRQAKILKKDLTDFKKTLLKFPSRASKIMENLEDGKIHVDVEDKDIHQLSMEIDRSSNRIAYGLVIAGLLIASSFMLQVDKGPHYLNIPIIALVTFIIATSLGLILLISILKEH